MVSISLVKNDPAQMAQDAVASVLEPVASIKLDMHFQRHSLDTVSKNALSDRD